MPLRQAMHSVDLSSRKHLSTGRGLKPLHNGALLAIALASFIKKTRNTYSGAAPMFPSRCAWEMVSLTPTF